MCKLDKFLRLRLILLILFFGLVANIGYCNSKKELPNQFTEEKIYVKSEQVEVRDDEIVAWIIEDGEKLFIFAKSVEYDEQGLYITPLKGPCGLHYQWCKICGGCGVLLCPMNCTCFD